MAALSFDDILCDADLIDTITVKPTVRLVADNGRAADLDMAAVPGVVAIVVPAAQKLILQSDGALRDGAIEIFTAYAISGGSSTDDSATRQPDVVTWHGRDYLVQAVEDYSAFGPGWVHATANLQQFNPTA